MKRKASSLGKGSKPKLARQNASGNLKTRRKSISLRDELKYNDVALATDASTTETVVALTTFAAGDTALLRDGNKIVCKSIEIRMILGNESLAQGNTVRVVVVKSTQANGAAPSWYLAQVGADVYDASNVVARRAVETASRYKIMMDETIVLNQIGSTGGSVSQAYFHKYIKLPDEITQFPSGASGIPITNAYYLMYMGSTASGATDCDVLGTVRLRFVG